MCVDALSGAEIYRIPTQGMIPCSAYYHEPLNQIICGSNDFHVRVCDAESGHMIYTWPTKGEVKGRVCVHAASHTCVAQTTAGYVYAWNLQTGVLLWHSQHGYSSLHAWPLIVHDTIYVTTDAQHVVGINCVTGHRTCMTKLRANVHWGIQSHKQCLLAHNEQGELLWMNLALEKVSHIKLPNAPQIVQPPVVQDNMLVVVTNDKGIYCVHVCDS